MAKAKTTSKGKSKPTAAKKGRTPAPKSGSGGILDLRRPPTIKASLAIATTLDSGKLPSLGDLQDSIMTRADYKELLLARNEAAEAGNDLPSLPFCYQGPIVEAAMKMGVAVIYYGQASKAKKQPNNWPSKAGAWEVGMTIGSPRRNHVPDLRKTVNSPDNLVDFNGTSVIIGDKDNAAVHCFNPHANNDGSVKSHYGAIAATDKSLSLDGVKGIGTVVFALNTTAVAVTVDDGTTPGAQMVWRANQVATAGTIVKDGKALTYNQIRALVKAGDFKGTKFVALSEEIVGNPISESELWPAVKTLKSNDQDWDEGKTLTNQSTICRSSSKDGSAVYPFGLKHGPQTNVALVRHYDEEAAADGERQVTVIVGVRIGTDYAENKWDAKARTADEQSETEAAPVAEAAVEVETAEASS